MYRSGGYRHMHVYKEKKDTNPSMLTEQEPKLNTILEF